jgi:hypothetical protein
MRRALVIALLVGVLLAIDTYFNDFRFAGAIYRSILEFGRVFTRTMAELF